MSPTIRTPLVAQTSIVVDLKSGLLSSSACALSHPAVEPYFSCKHNIHFSALVRMNWAMNHEGARGLVILLL